MNMSTFGEHESLVLDISSPANKIRYCEGIDRSLWLQNKRKRIEAYPGGWFTIHLIDSIGTNRLSSTSENSLGAIIMI